MVWMDEVLAFDANQNGETVVTLKPEGLYWDDQGLRPSSCLEFIAQAYGYISVCYHIYILDPNSKPLTKAFLASVKDATIPSREMLKDIKPGDRINVKIAFLRQMGPIQMITGRVFKGSTLICEAQMKLFKES